MLVPISLLLISIVAGVVLLWVFSKTSNQAAIRATKKRLQARLLELRLYADDPGVVLRAQKELLIENGRYFFLMLRPAVFATLPMVLLLIFMDGYYGHQPLAPGQSAVLTVQLTAPEASSDEPRLQAPEGIAVETAGVRATDIQQVSWRIRPEQAASGDLRIHAGGEDVTKKIDAGDGAHYLASRRSRSWMSWLLQPAEARLNGSGIDWIELDYPTASVSYFGVATHWLVWFMLFSMVTALLFKGRFHVTI